VTVRIGGGQGFYGDGIPPVSDLLADGVDYLVCEALAELTLAILQKDRQRDEALGYTRDLPLYLQSALPFVLEGRTRFITNAGGINPVAAGRAAIAASRAAGAEGTGLRVATIVGDDVRARAGELDIPDASGALFASVYLGARPIVEALDAGAQVIITGRVADASLFVAPLVHEFGWAWDDWNRLAAGVAVGHLLECSGQVTGGNYSGRWWEGWPGAGTGGGAGAGGGAGRIGFPIAEVEPDGSAVITKPRGTGGRVSFDTVREQLLYEVHDPGRYLNPDVVADFTSLALTDEGADRVRVAGARGLPAPSTYKGLVCTPAGWAGECRLAYTWPDAEAKARAALGFVRARAEADGVPVEEWCEEYFGVNAYGGPTVEVPEDWQPPEVIGRLAWRCADAGEAARPGRAIGVLGLSGPPGISGVGRGGAGKPTQLLAVDPFFAERDIVDKGVRIEIEEL
jgi:Acyclic terpene utilisation family protein AtuA